MENLTMEDMTGHYLDKITVSEKKYIHLQNILTCL